MAIVAYVLGTFYPDSRVQQAQVATAQITPTQAITITQTQPPAVPVATITPQETVVPLPEVDPQQAMAYALVQAGINTSSPGGQYMMSRATAVQGMYEIHTGNFTSYSAQDLGAFMKGWADKSNYPISSDIVQDWRQRVDNQLPAKADEILRTTDPGTPGFEFRRMVQRRIALGYGDVGQIYWEHLVDPVLEPHRLTNYALQGETAKYRSLYTQYQAASFAGQATDFGIFLVQQGYRLSKD